MLSKTGSHFVSDSMHEQTMCIDATEILETRIYAFIHELMQGFA